jgi:hypothetical protein
MIRNLFNSKRKLQNIHFFFRKPYWLDERLSTIRPFAFSISLGNACKLFRLRSSVDKSGLLNKRADICVADTWLSRNDNERNDVKSFKHNGTSGKSLCAKLNFS